MTLLWNPGNEEFRSYPTFQIYLETLNNDRDIWGEDYYSPCYLPIWRAE